MAYNDIMYITYNFLKSRAKNQRPYQHTTDTFPLGDRRYSHRHFRVNEDGTFDIYLGHRESVDAGLSGKETKCQDSKQTERYADKAHIARVHPDNTIEFLSTRGGFSDLLVYDAMIYGCRVKQCSKHGGATMYFERDGVKGAHPLFHGIRVNLSDLTVHESTDYVTYLPTLKRKEAAQYMTRFDEFFKTYHVFIKSMAPDAYPEMVADIFEEYRVVMDWNVDNEFKLDMRNTDKLANVIADLISKKRYADAAFMSVAFERPWTVQRMYTVHKGMGQVQGYLADSICEAIDSGIAKLNYYLTKARPELFTFKRIESGQPLPTSKWGIATILKSNDAPVVRL